MTIETHDRIQNHLNEHEIYPEVIYDDGYFYTCLEIRGDWKHEHLYADYLMKQIGYDLHHETVTEWDGSDFYTATRYYLTPEIAESIGMMREFM